MLLDWNGCMLGTIRDLRVLAVRLERSPGGLARTGKRGRRMGRHGGGRGLREKEGSKEGRMLSENPMVRRAKMLKQDAVFLTR